MKKAIVALIPILVLAILAGISTMPAIASDGPFDVYWEQTSHPKYGPAFIDPATPPSWPNTELVGRLTGGANHIEITFQDYPSYTFTKEYVEVFDKKEGYYEWKGAILEYFWMSDRTLLASGDVDAYIAANPGVSVFHHMKDYFLGLSDFDGNGELQWQIYRQYSYWIQTAYTASTYGFPEAIGERIHADWTDSTYVSSTTLWQATATYFVIPAGGDLADYYGILATIGNMNGIYAAFPATFTGFGYKWLP